MRIAPKIEIHESIVDEKNQRKNGALSKKSTVRTNNRKTTRSRKVQFCVTVKSVFPLIIVRKNIKTNA